MKVQLQLLLALLVATSLGCGTNLYELPDPPPREAWQRHSLSPSEDAERSHRDFLAASNSVVSFLEAMDREDFSAAYELLSNETRILLDDLSPSGLGESVLEDGLILREGAEFIVDPVDLFVISDIQDLSDEQDDRQESETYRRKEMYAIGADGEVHQIVMIYEGNSWRIHKARINLSPGAPGRRTATET